MKKILTPTNTLIEETAAQLAAEWYNIGRSQGLLVFVKMSASMQKKILNGLFQKQLNIY